MTLRSLLFLALAPAFSAVAHAAPVNLVTNGSFEQGTLGIGSFAGWQTTLGDSSTFVDSSGQTGRAYGQATDGKWAAYFGSTQADGGASIAQTLQTTAGQVYSLSFDLANDNGGLQASNSFSAYLAGVQVFSATNLASQGFVHEQIAFQATTTATALRLFGFNDQSYVELDNVAVTATTPEPSSLWLLTTGLLCVGIATFVKRPSGDVRL